MHNSQVGSWLEPRYVCDDSLAINMALSSSFDECPEVGIYKRKQESKKTKTRLRKLSR